MCKYVTNGVTHKGTLEVSKESKFLIGNQLSAIRCNSGAIMVQNFTNGVTHNITVEFSKESIFLIGFQLSAIRCISGAIK